MPVEFYIIMAGRDVAMITRHIIWISSYQPMMTTQMAVKNADSAVLSVIAAGVVARVLACNSVERAILYLENVVALAIIRVIN